MKKIQLILSLLFLGFNLMGQELISTDDCLVNGFDQKITGDDFSYHSSIPNIEKAIIIRATDGNYSMEWQSERVPETVKEKYVTLVWLAGIGSSPGLAPMHLTINNDQHLTFYTDGKKEWKINGTKGEELFFQADMEDQHGDKFGFIFLRIPKDNLDKGKPVRLKITGGNANKSSWYMTFQMPVRSGISINTYPAILKGDNQNKQLASGNLIYFGRPSEASIYIDGKLIKKQPIKFGYNYFRIGLPEVTKNTRRSMRMAIDSFSKELTFIQSPVRQWHVNFVQHSHTDIGYTRSQTEILAEHLRYIDYALDYCDATDHYPDNAKFRWTCEASWAVDEFLKCRPAAQIERLKNRVKEGRIEIAAMYFNFDELPEEQVLAASLQPLKHFKEHGLATKMAMQNDVNGIAWCMNDFYSDLGVKYLNMGTHGHRALICFDIPTLFWWESPSGKRMLAFRAEHYMTGNTVFEIHKGNIENFETRMLNYLTSLAKLGYSYNTISIQHSGYLTDNAPPSTIASDLIRQWNEIYEWPKLKTATATSFFEEMESKYANTFPVYKGAWPDWWTDGFGASAREVAAVRKAQASITANSGGLTMAKLMGTPLPKNIEQRIDLVNNAILFYTEHTVGYSESVREPYHEQTMEQRAIKESYAWESFRRAKMIGEETMGLLQNHISNEAKPILVIYNTLNWKRNGLITVYIDHQLIPRDTYPLFIDSEGKNHPAQPLSHRSDGTYWAVWVNDVPAFGYKKLIIETTQPPLTTPITTAVTQMENQWYKIVVDPAKAAIISWMDKNQNKELIDQKSLYGMGEIIYETLGNRHQMEQKRLDDFKRFGLDTAWFESFTQGPVYNTILMKGKTQASYDDHDVKIEIRLFNTNKRVELAYSIVKKPIIDPEGLYIAFPFLLENGKHQIEVAGGHFEAGVNQIPGSANDWNTVQNYSALKNKQAQIIIGSPEIPLVQFGGINTGRYKAGAVPESTHLYSWPMNNYWVTNFNPDQKGEHQWTYYLTSSDDPSNTIAAKFGWSSRIPFLTRVLPGNGTRINNWETSLITGWPENVILTNAMPGKDKNGIILQIRETEGKVADLSTLMLFNGKSASVTQVNAIGEPVNLGSSIMQPYSNAFYHISW